MKKNESFHAKFEYYGAETFISIRNELRLKKEYEGATNFVSIKEELKLANQL